MNSAIAISRNHIEVCYYTNMKHTQDTPKKRDTVLDFWRGVSILFVIIHHLFYFRIGIFKDYYFLASPGNSLEAIPWYFNAALIEFSERSGPIGVKIFFVISGYIITKLLLDEELSAKSVSIKSFYLRRAFRILPPYLFYLTFVLLFGLLGWVAINPAELLYATGFICNLPISECGWNIAHTWSLAIEEQFYLIWPILFVFVGFRFRTGFLSLALGTFIGLSALGYLIVDSWLNNALSFACIATGALYATSQKFRVFMQRHSLHIIATIFLINFIFYKISYINEFSRQFYRNSSPFLILAAIITTYKFKWLFRTTIYWSVSKIGIVSYSLYLWQELFLAPAANYLTPSPLQWPILVIPAVLLSYLYIEMPSIAFIRGKISKSNNKKRDQSISALSQIAP